MDDTTQAVPMTNPDAGTPTTPSVYTKEEIGESMTDFDLLNMAGLSVYVSHMAKRDKVDELKIIKEMGIKGVMSFLGELYPEKVVPDYVVQMRTEICATI